jgi:hypothetical protein
MTAVEWLINYFLEYGYNFGLMLNRSTFVALCITYGAIKH